MCIELLSSRGAAIECRSQKKKCPSTLKGSFLSAYGSLHPNRTNKQLLPIPCGDKREFKPRPLFLVPWKTKGKKNVSTLLFCFPLKCIVPLFPSLSAVVGS